MKNRLPVEHLPDGSRDLSFGKRLHRKCSDACRLGLSRIDEVAVAGAHDDGHVGLYGKCLPGKVQSCHLRHSDIGDDEVESRLVFFKKAEGLFSVRPRCDIVAQFGEDVFTYLDEGLLIVDEEDALRAGRDCAVRGPSVFISPEISGK